MISEISILSDRPLLDGSLFFNKSHCCGFRPDLDQIRRRAGSGVVEESACFRNFSALLLSKPAAFIDIVAPDTDTTMLDSTRNIALACALSALAGYVDGIGFIHLGGL